ncbi:MAG: site-specific DNA-methyltransferase [Acidobacteria bacterium]|nr:site-specific DNA-methyltransferase [Acidobacteriota bacterium]
MNIELGEIYNENCLETMQRMPDGFIDMTLTSPPYDDLREYNGYHFPVEEISVELYRVTADGGVVVWVVGDRTVNGDETLTSFKHAFAFREAGFKVHDTMIYAKNNPIPSDCGKRYRQCFEYMFCFSKGQPKTFNPLTMPIKQEKAFKSFRITSVGRNDLAHDHVAPKERKLNNIFFYNVGTSSSRDKIAFGHPAIFPEKLAEDQITTWTNDGDIVYDPFMGSGTTAKAALLLGRQWLGSEISSEYVDIAETRIAAYLDEPKIAAVK